MQHFGYFFAFFVSDVAKKNQPPYRYFFGKDDFKARTESYQFSFNQCVTF